MFLQKAERNFADPQNELFKRELPELQRMRETFESDSSFFFFSFFGQIQATHWEETCYVLLLTRIYDQYSELLLINSAFQIILNFLLHILV